MSSPRVLLIEPDKLIASNVSQFLSKRGYKVDWRPSAQSAIVEADEHSPQAVILDIQLANHGGVEFLHELRSYGDWQSVPVIIYSSIHPDELGGQQNAQAMLTAAAYLHKPTDSLDVLSAKLSELIKVEV